MVIRQRQLFIRLFLINFLIAFGFTASDTFFPLFCQSLGAKGILLGAAVSGYAIAKIVLSPVMGKMGDRLGCKFLIQSSLALYTIISCSYLFIETPFQLVVVRLLQGGGYAMFRPAVQSLVAAQIAPEQPGRTMGTFDISFYAALSIGPIVGGAVKNKWGFHGLFVVLALCCIVSFVMALQSQSIFTGERKRFKGAPPSFTILTLLSLDPRGGTLRGLLAYILGRGVGISTCATFLPLMLSSRIGLNSLQIGVVMASATLVMAFLLRPMGKITDRLSYPILVALGGIIVPLLYLLLSVSDSFGKVLVLALLIGVFSSISQPAASALLIAEGQRLGMSSTLGIFNAFLNLGFTLGPLIGSVFLSMTGIQSIFLAICIVGLATAAIFIWQLNVSASVEDNLLDDIGKAALTIPVEKAD